MFFSVLKFIHVLAAATAVGANVTYGIWIARASRQPQNLPFVLDNVRLIDNRVANPCYALLLLSGLTMAFTIPLPLTTPWLLTALVIYILMALAGALVYSRVMRSQIQLLEKEGFQSQAYQAVARRSTQMGVVLVVLVVVIIFLMVAKPSLWG